VFNINIHQTSLRRQVGATTIARAVNLLFALVVAMILARMLTEELYGAYRKIWLIYAITGPIAISALTNTLYYRGSVSEENKIPAIWAILCMAAFFAMGFALLGFAGARWWAQFLNAVPHTVAFQHFSLYILLTILSGTAEPLFILLQRKKWLLVFNISYNVIETLIITGAFWYGLSLAQVTLVMAAGPAIRIFMVAFLLVKERVKPPGWWAIWAEIPASVRYSLGIIGTAFVGLAVHDVDKWIVGNFYDNDALYAIYSIGARRLPVYVLSGSIATSLVTHFSEEMANNDFKNILSAIKKATNTLALFILPGMLFCIIFAEDLMVLIFKKYAESAHIFQIYVLASLSGLFFPNALIMGKGLSFVQAKFAVVELVVNIGLSLLLIRLMGLQGPALATLVGVIVYTILQIQFCKKHFGVSASSFLPDWKLWPMIVTLGVFGGLLFWVNTTFTAFYAFPVGLLLLLVILGVHQRYLNRSNKFWI